jgi:ankyrin repeat protein
LQTIVNPSPEYINAEFPHGRRHQYISIMGTAWAARALAQALPESKPTAEAFGIPNLAPTDTSGWITAALNGSVDDLTAALKDGLSPDAKTAGGTTILMLAARHPKLVNLLIERGANVHARADSGLTALHVASRYRGNADVVRALLSKGATVNAPAGVSVTNDASPLFFAAANGDTEIAKLLIQAGAAVDAEMNVLGMMKQTPLETAVQRGDTDMVRTLLAHQANPNRASQDGATPLHRAVIGNHADIIALLVSKGARINQADVNGMTALHYAACVDGGSDQVIKALLAAGADPLRKDKEGKTARDMAQECRHQVLVDALSR